MSDIDNCNELPPHQNGEVLPNIAFKNENISFDKVPMSCQSDSYKRCSESFIRDDSIIEYEFNDMCEPVEGSDAVFESTSEVVISGACSSLDGAMTEISLENEDVNQNFPPVEVDVEENVHFGSSSASSSELNISALSENCNYESFSKEDLIKIYLGVNRELLLVKQDKIRLQADVDRLEADKSSVIYTAHLEALERALSQAQADACSWQEKLKENEAKWRTENLKIREELTSHLEDVTRQLEVSTKEKESMVVKYAMSEKKVILAENKKGLFEKKLMEAEKEKENAVTKAHLVIGEKSRLCQALENKVQEYSNLTKEVDKLKEELNSRDIKIKWAQARLKTEIDSHKDTQARLDRTLIKITKHELEMKSIQDEAEKVVQSAHESETSRAILLDKQLQEEKAKLIMEKQMSDDQSCALKSAVAELETLRCKYSNLQDECKHLKSKVSQYETEREESETLFKSLRAEMEAVTQEASNLRSQLTEVSSDAAEVERLREKLNYAEEEVSILKAQNSDLEIEMKGCRDREAELLSFTQKLSDKNAELQSRTSLLESKTRMSEAQNETLQSRLTYVEEENVKLCAEIDKEKDAMLSQEEQSKSSIKVLDSNCTELRLKVSDLESEIKVLKRKNANTVKDLTREVSKLQKHLETQEGFSRVDCASPVMMQKGSEVPLHASRASSETSLGTPDMSHNCSSNANSDASESKENSIDIVAVQQLLLNRVVKLQKSLAKKSEKIEFLEDHILQLVGELKKKTKIIHHYFLKEEAGVLTNSKSDDAKTELIKRGGIMASVYGSHSKDCTMTLDLSLEINHKLQAVLEDTLLKNITLKENLNTLADEVARLSLQSRSSLSEALPAMPSSSS